MLLSTLYFRESQSNIYGSAPTEASQSVRGTQPFTSFGRSPQRLTVLKYSGHKLFDFEFPEDIRPREVHGPGNSDEERACGPEHRRMGDRSPQKHSVGEVMFDVMRYDDSLIFHLLAQGRPEVKCNVNVYLYNEL